jgi:hypothetical protein
MRKRPEEYEPLIMIVDENDDDDDDDDNVVNKTSSIRGVRDSSSTSSLQYQRHVPMLLSYASPQQQEPMVGHRNQYRHNLHRNFLKRRDILTREPLHHHSTFTNPQKHFSYDPDHECGNRTNKDKLIHRRDDGEEISARRNTTATSYHQLCSSSRNQYTEQKEHRDEWMMMDTDTVGAVAPNSTVSNETRNDDWWMMQQHDVEPILPPPTNQVIMFPRRFVLDT